MSFWRSEYEKEKAAHKTTRFQLDVGRDLIVTVRAFLRSRKLEKQFLEFMLAAKIGEEAAAKLIADVHKEQREDRAKAAARGCA